MNSKERKTDNLQEKEFIIKKITEKKELIATINYLGKNFKWSNKRSQQIYQYLISQNKDDLIYGYYLINKFTNIVGAILISYQADYINEGCSIRVVNLMSWFIDRSVRGMAGLITLSSIRRDFSDCIITNYTPNKNVIKLFMALGWSKMETIQSYYSLLDLIVNINFKNPRMNNLKPPPITCSSIKPRNLSHSNNRIHNFRFKLKDVSYDISGIKTISMIKLIGIPLLLPSFIVLYSSSTDLDYRDWSSIYKMLLLRTLVPLIIFDKKPSTDFKYNLHNNNYISLLGTDYIYKSRIKNVSYIPPIGGELSLDKSFFDFIKPIISNRIERLIDKIYKLSFK